MHEHFEDELGTPHALDSVLDRGAINVSHEIGSALPLREFLRRTQHSFQHEDLGYRYVSADTFKLKVRSRKYPLFGSFSGSVHLYEKLPKLHPNYSTYAMEGLLEYRMSFLWFISVASFFFLLANVFKPGLFFGALLEAVGTGLVVYSTYQLGRKERKEVADRLDAAVLRLRATQHNIR